MGWFSWLLYAEHYLRPELPCVTRHTGILLAGVIVEEINHILLSIRCRILQNCRIVWGAEFIATNHTFVVDRIKIHAEF